MPLLTDWLLPFFAGAVTGVLTAFGVGGGTLLLIWLTVFVGLPQPMAQGINLLYFLPAAAAALPSHFKNGFVDRPIALRAGGAGLLCAGLSAWVAAHLEVALLRRCFGVFLLVTGITQLLRTKRADRAP